MAVSEELVPNRARVRILLGSGLLAFGVVAIGVASHESTANARQLASMHASAACIKAIQSSESEPVASDPAVTIACQPVSPSDIPALVTKVDINDYYNDAVLAGAALGVVGTGFIIAGIKNRRS